MIDTLRGIKVLDLTQGLCGPYAGQLLGDIGADIIKVEPIVGDYARDFGPPFLDGQSATFLSINRNKRSIALDLASNQGRAIVARLIEKADVLLEDLGPGVAEE